MLPLQRKCDLADIVRSSYYRFLAPVPQRSPGEQEVIDALHRICEDYPFYGYRRVCVELNKTIPGVNHKRVLRLMRQEGLVVRPRRRYLHTTDSDHDLRIYDNLLKHAAISSINQAWVADLTYIAYGRRTRQFAYLAVILDDYSRKVIGWCLGRHVDASLTLGALEMALHTRDVSDGMIHHSDRGVQYACRRYVALLAQYGVDVSMSARGNPYENAKAESFMKTIKCEEVYRHEYDTFEEVAESIYCYIEDMYNPRRLHSALGYTSPVRFEENLTTLQTYKPTVATRKMTVSK